jgi:hypothetical protein
MSADSARLPEALAHIIDGTASEVLCDDDRIALCRSCFDKMAYALLMGDVRTTCPACLWAIVLKTAATIEGREYLERDGIAGHVGHN